MAEKKQKRQKSISLPNGLAPAASPGCFNSEKQNWFWTRTVSWLNPTDLYEIDVFLVFKVKYCNMQLPLPGISHPFVYTQRAPRQPKFGLKTEFQYLPENPELDSGAGDDMRL